ncbi:MAG: DUF2937 family protein [Chlamydiia bacterium]|nr:DUF2937 family protein [Chlamydiia bacterium]
MTEEKKGVVKSFGALLDTVMDRIFAVLGALIFSQGPAFIQQYIQNLSGAVSELKLQVDRMTTLASKGGKDLPTYIKKFIASSDPDISGQGEIMQLVSSRYTSLNGSLESLSGAHFWSKPFHFLMNFHSDIFSRTLDYFRPGINLTFEGLIWALAGLLIGYFLYTGIKNALCKLGRRVKNATVDHRKTQ